MKAKFLTLVVSFIFMISYTKAQLAKVDVNTTTIEWLGKKIGGEHNGNILVKSGSINLKDDQIVAGSVVIDMNSITNIDLKDEGYNQKLVGHLKSDDFFGVSKYPTAEINDLKSSKFNNGKASVTGKITIKGKTENISFDVMKEGNSYSANVEIDRSKFDVRYGSNSFFDNLGNKAIDDIFTLKIKLVTK